MLPCHSARPREHFRRRGCAGGGRLFASWKREVRRRRRVPVRVLCRRDARAWGDSNSSMARGLEGVSIVPWRWASSECPPAIAIGAGVPHRGVCGSLFRCIVYADPVVSSHSRRRLPWRSLVWRETAVDNWTTAFAALAPSIAHRAGRLLCCRVARPDLDQATCAISVSVLVHLARLAAQCQSTFSTTICSRRKRRRRQNHNDGWLQADRREITISAAVSTINTKRAACCCSARSGSAHFLIVYRFLPGVYFWAPTPLARRRAITSLLVSPSQPITRLYAVVQHTPLAPYI